MHSIGESNSFGEWLFPNGESIVRNSATGTGFYWIRYYQVVRLYRQGDIQTPLGRYCCRIPDSGRVNRTFCANLIGELCIIICSDLDIPFQQHNVTRSCLPLIMEW